MNSGWTKNWRKKWDNPSLKGRPNHLLVWDWVVSNAEWKQKNERAQVRFNGQVMVLGLGQLTCGSIVIAEFTGVAQSTVRRVLNDLTNEHLIERQTDNHCSLITVKNWEQYQGDERPDDQPVSSRRAASEQQVSTNKEYKNTKNIHMSVKKLREGYGVQPNGEVISEQRINTGFHVLEHALSAKRPFLREKRLALMVEALRQYSVEQLEEIWMKMAENPFLMGQNPSKTKYLTADYALRAVKLEEYFNKL